jgi:transcriptional regulator with XRE-family HTH domain
MDNTMSDNMVIKPEQCLGARAMLGWSREELATCSKVSPATLADFEAAKRAPYERTLIDIRKTLEAEGVEFLQEDGKGPGVRLRWNFRCRSCDAKLLVGRIKMAFKRRERATCPYCSSEIPARDAEYLLQYELIVLPNKILSNEKAAKKLAIMRRLHG